MQFERVDVDVWQAHPRRPGIRWFGLPFALAGLLPVAGAVGLIPFTSESGEPASPVVLALFGGVFLAVGLGLLFYGVTLRVDLRAGTITRRAGALGIGRTTSRPREGFAAVVHCKKVSRGSKSSRTVYPVTLESERDRGFELVHCREPRAARQTAEQLAKLLELPVIDRTDGTDHRREFDELDHSLRELRQRSGERPALGPAPTGMKSHIDVQGDEIAIAIPACGFTPLHLIGLVLATGPIWMVAIFLYAAGDDDMPLWFSGTALAMGAIPALAMLGTVAFHALRRFDVRVSHDELRVVERGLRAKTTVLPASEVEELRLAEVTGNVALARLLGGGPPIVAISDTAMVAFGSSLKEREAEYLVGVIGGALSAPAG